jgi:hypothetical protein
MLSKSGLIQCKMRLTPVSPDRLPPPLPFGYDVLRDRRGPRRPFGRKSVFELSCSNRRPLHPTGVLREAKPLGRLKTEEAQLQVYCKSFQESNNDFMLASAVMLVRHVSNLEQFGEGPYSEMSRLHLMVLASLIPQI